MKLTNKKANFISNIVNWFKYIFIYAVVIISTLLFSLVRKENTK
jgi:hypothetical protein